MFMNETKFGVEVEFCGITRMQAAEVISKRFGHSYERSYGTYDKYSIKDGFNRKWEIMRDASIDAIEEKKCELVTPVLIGDDDVETLQEIIRLLRKAGAQVNDSCGIHVHVSHYDLDSESIRKLAIQWASKENAVYTALKVHSNRMGYTRKTDVNFLNKIKSKNRVDDISDTWYEDWSGPRNGHYHNSRYHALNLHSWFQHNNVEFRCFNSTLHAGKVKAYIQFCVANVCLAIKSKHAVYKEMPSKKANMASWFVKLGLVGDKYKTCRKHMSAGLAA